MQKIASLFVWPKLTRFITLLVLGIGMVLSLYAFYSWRQLEAADTRVQFAKTAADYMVAVRANVLKAAIAVGYLGAAFEAARDLDRTGFDRFAATIIRNNPVITRVAWLPVVRSDNRAAIEAEAVVNGMKHFQITARDWAFPVGDVSSNDVFYPVFYVAPYAGNETLIGLDVGSDERAQKALEQAARTRGIVAMANVAGFLDYDRATPSFFVFISVWTRAPAGADRQLRGFIVGQVNLLRSVLDGAPPTGPLSPQIAIFDLSAPPSEELIYPARLDGMGPDDIAAAGGSYWDFDVGVTRWRLGGLPQGPLEPGLTWQSTLVLISGLAISANLAGYLQLLGRRRKHVEQLVHVRTEEVETALAQLKVTEHRLNDYIVTASDWYWEAGANYRFTKVDRAREFGIDPTELVGLDQLLEGNSAIEIEKRLAVLARHKPFKELRYDYASGKSLLILSLSGVPKFDENGAFRGYRGSARDITQKLRMDVQQREARWAAEQANNAKSAFLANMSHEIRTPMNGVLGMVQILRQTKLDEDQGRMCEIISQSGAALLQILNDILDFSKLEAGKIELESVECCLIDVVSDVVSLMRHSAEPKGLSLVFEHDPIASPWVIGDPTRLRQILLNLISNAIKFSTQGGVVIRLEMAQIAGQQAKIVLSVTDHGIGITAEEQARLFKRFSQGDVSLTRRFGGTGLGLAITQELVRLMGGAIAVHSKLGKGSTFTVDLNLPLATHQGVTIAQASAPLRTGPQACLNILVAEDDSINRVVIGRMLQAQGHAVTMVENGQEAIEALLVTTYDLVLMDVMMPGTDGVTATRRVREGSASTRTVPIIALTANAMKGDRDTYLAAGMNAYVSKPIDKGKLFETIEQVLNIRAWTPSSQDVTPASTPSAHALSALDDFISSI